MHQHVIGAKQHSTDDEAPEQNQTANGRKMRLKHRPPHRTVVSTGTNYGAEGDLSQEHLQKRDAAN